MVVYRRHCNCRQLLSSLPMIRHRHCLCFIVVVICILHSMSLLFCSRDRISCFIVVLPQHRCNTFNKKLSAVCTILHDYLFTVAVSGVMTAVFFRGLNCLALSCSEFWGCRPCPQPENRSCLSPIPYPLDPTFGTIADNPPPSGWQQAAGLDCHSNLQTDALNWHHDTKDLLQTKSCLM